MLSFVEITIGHSAIDNKDSYDKNYDKTRDGDDYKDVDEDGIAIFAWVYWATSEELLNRSYWGGAVLCMFFPYWEIYLNWNNSLF